MTIDWWTLGLQAVNVVILVWILARFLFKPVSAIITERQQAANEALEEARAEADKAEAEHARARAETKALVAKRAALIAEAEREATTEKKALLQQARAEAEKARAAGQVELDRLRVAEQKELANQAARLATDIAARLLARLPDSARVAGFIDGLAKAVSELPEATRAGIVHEGPVPLKAARTLTGDEIALLTRRLAEVLGREVALDISTDPTLIAGLELDAPHAIVRNHFRADLDRITAELESDD